MPTVWHATSRYFSSCCVGQKSPFAVFAAIMCAAFFAVPPATAEDYHPKQAPIMTRFSGDVFADNVHAEYPRPQLVRQAWQNLNGLWEYAIRPQAEGEPQQFDGQILVPFPVESALSGVMQRVPEDACVWYRRTFSAPPLAKEGRLLLHFGACDWKTVAWVNGKQVGTHQGGYDPFTFDITDALTAGGKQQLVVSVIDSTDASYQPRGKQVRKPGGIWYTPTTGIWQTVWLEPVSKTHIQSINITPDIDQGQVTIDVKVANAPAGLMVHFDFGADRKQLTVPAGQPAVVQWATTSIADSDLWSPEQPTLHEVEISLSAAAPQNTGTSAAASSENDMVRTYFAFRKISLGKDARGLTRIFLNNQPYFQYGPLDQGFWPDGLYTAPTDEA